MDPEGNHVIPSADYHHVRVWNLPLKDGMCRLEDHSALINAVAIEMIKDKECIFQALITGPSTRGASISVRLQSSDSPPVVIGRLDCLN